MAEDKSNEAKEGEAAKTKRGPLVPAILVALGAAVGGAGVVFFAPRPKVEEHGPAQPDLQQVEHPDAMDFTFNPQVERGQKNAIIKLVFVYEVDSRNSAAALKDIKDYWTRAYSRCLLVLKNRPATAFTNDEGIKLLTKELSDELTASFFPDGIAKVDDILWLKIMVQG